MKLAAIALDYDGTIAVNGAPEPSVRAAIAGARDAGIAIILATGRRLADLARVGGDLTCFDVIVAENGAVIDFPSRGRHVLLGHPPHPSLVYELKRRGLVHDVGECSIEADASTSRAIIELIHGFEQPLVLTFNKGRVMALPQAVGKSTGVRHALETLRVSIHNTLAIGDCVTLTTGKPPGAVPSSIDCSSPPRRMTSTRGCGSTSLIDIQTLS